MNCTQFIIFRLWPKKSIILVLKHAERAKKAKQLLVELGPYLNEFEKGET